MNSGKNYKIGNTFRAIGGKQDNNNLTYITVTNVGIDGEISNNYWFGYYDSTINER